MSDNQQNPNNTGKWQMAMDQMTKTSGAVFSNKALRKYFKDNYCKSHTNRTFIDMADVYGQIVSSGCFYEKLNKLQPDGSFYLSSKYIAGELSLSVRRVRDIVIMLCEHGLIDRNKKDGEANRYIVHLEKFNELVKDVKFKHRKYESRYTAEQED